MFLTLDPVVRLARLEERERRRYGDRIGPGGDLEPALHEFLDWAKGYDDPGFDGRNPAGRERGSQACAAWWCGSTPSARSTTWWPPSTPERASGRPDPIGQLATSSEARRR